MRPTRVPYAKELFAVNALEAFRFVQHSHQPDDRESILDDCDGVLNALRRSMPDLPVARRHDDDEFEDDDLYEDDEFEDDDLDEDDLDEDDLDDDEFEDDELDEDDDLYDDDETDHPSFRKLFPIQDPDRWIGDPQRTELPRYYLN
jgi:hypothetical protein